MIIDVGYIKEVLNTEVDDSVIAYLIKHFFTYTCSYAKIDSSLTEEEILTINQETPLNPNILEDDLTLFQETIIYGIGCELTEMGYLETINTQIQDKYPEYSTYCDFFNNCLQTLDAYLNETSEIQCYISCSYHWVSYYFHAGHGTVIFSGSCALCNRKSYALRAF